MANDVEAVDSIDAIRKRPGMYVGDCRDGSGLHHLVSELVANVVDLHLSGACGRLQVTVHTDGSITVEDDGPGIPVEERIHGHPFLETIATELHVGPTFDGRTKHVHLADRGVGLVAVNALSSIFSVDVARGGALHRQVFHRGRPTGAIAVVSETTKTGTAITFAPDPTIFTAVEFDGELLRDRMRQVAFLNPGFVVGFVDERTEFCAPRGVVDFATYLARGRSVIPEHPIHARVDEQGIRVDAALYFATNGQPGHLRSFANQHRTHGGTHHAGLRSALDVLENLFEHLQEEVRARHVDALFDRVVGVLSVTHFDPKFDSPTRSVLENAEVGPLVAATIGAVLRAWIGERPEEARRLSGVRHE